MTTDSARLQASLTAVVSIGKPVIAAITSFLLFQRRARARAVRELPDSGRQRWKVSQPEILLQA